MFILNNIIATLEEKKKTLMYKNGSFLNNLSIDSIYTSLGDKLLNEINLFKTELYPLMKYFKSELDGVVNTKTPTNGFIEHQIYTLPLCVPVIVKENSIEPQMSLYKPIALNGTYDSMVDLEIEDLKSYFISEQVPVTSALKPILDDMTTDDIKRFLSEYCTIFYDVGSEEIYKGRKSYRAFGESSLKAMYHLRDLCLIWGFVQIRLNSDDTKSNMSSHDERITLLAVTKDIEQLISIGYNHYLKYTQDDVIAFELKETNEGPIKYLHVFDVNLPKLIEKSSQDPYCALYGSHSSIVSIFENEDSVKVIRKLNDLIDNEDKFCRNYNKMVEMVEVRNQELFIRNLKRHILNISRNTYELYIMSGEDKENTHTKLKEYTSSKNAVEFTDKVYKYLETVKDEQLTSNSALTSADVIGKILFDKTYFGVFLDSQSQLESIVDDFDVKEEQEITLWVINFLTRFLVESLEIQ